MTTLISIKNSIDLKFQELRKAGKKAFITFITAGDPSLEITEELVLSFDKIEVDIVELGIPFSDPLADGSTIQASSQRALSTGVTLKGILKTVERIRKHSKIPIALMTYYNPVFHFSEQKFILSAKKVGVDGIIIPDLPPEEGKNLISICRKNNLSTVFFLAPTTTPKRMKKIIEVSTGFIYYVSLTGVTGSRQKLPVGLVEDIHKVKAITSKPVCVGFGISNTKQIHDLCRIADGVIVGSAIIQEIQKNASNPFGIEKVQQFVKKLVVATHNNQDT